eukprot:gene7403-biopygen19551
MRCFLHPPLLVLSAASGSSFCIVGIDSIRRIMTVMITRTCERERGEASGGVDLRRDCSQGPGWKNVPKCTLRCRAAAGRGGRIWQGGGGLCSDRAILSRRLDSNGSWGLYSEQQCRGWDSGRPPPALARSIDPETTAPMPPHARREKMRGGDAPLPPQHANARVNSAIEQKCDYHVPPVA